MLCLIATLTVILCQMVISAYSKGGNKGINQDSFIVWEGFGGKEYVMLCGVFSEHRPWGDIIGKRVKKVLAAYLLHYWQEAMAQCSILLDGEFHKNANFDQFGVSKNSFIKACSMDDYDLELHPVINSFYSGTVAVTIIRQGDLIMLANVGDYRAVLGTTSDDGEVIAVQLTVDFKPRKREDIHNRRSVCESDDEPGVSRIRASIDETPEGPGLALSRDFRDFFFVKMLLGLIQVYVFSIQIDKLCMDFGLLLLILLILFFRFVHLCYCFNSTKKLKIKLLITRK
ncbi:putative PPM-type phosphatase domain, protein phosphatase 2C family [Helianthus anomalus]